MAAILYPVIHNCININNKLINIFSGADSIRSPKFFFKTHTHTPRQMFKYEMSVKYRVTQTEDSDPPRAAGNTVRPLKRSDMTVLSVVIVLLGLCQHQEKKSFLNLAQTQKGRHYHHATTLLPSHIYLAVPLPPGKGWSIRTSRMVFFS